MLFRSATLNLADFVFYTNFEAVHEQLQDGEMVVTEIQCVDIGRHEPFTAYVKNFIPNNCLIFPTHLADEILFDSHIAYEDWDFLLSAASKVPMRHLPIFGPRIHKNSADDVEQRGKSNNAKLVECYIKTYEMHPPPNPLVAQLRRELFSSVGLDIG